MTITQIIRDEYAAMHATDRSRAGKRLAGWIKRFRRAGRDDEADELESEWSGIWNGPLSDWEKEEAINLLIKRAKKRYETNFG